MNNFVDEYVAYASDFCDAPNIYHFFCGLGALSSVISRKVCMPFGVKDLHPNLWLLLIGTSGERKSSAIAIADFLLSKSQAAPIFPNEFSREALMEIFQKHGSGVFLISEYSNLMGIMRRNYNDGVIGFLTDIYDVPRLYRRETFGKGSIEIEKPCPNIIAGTTPEYMKTSADEWFSGWGPRFIVVPGERKRLIPIPPMPNRDREERLITFLKNARYMEPTNFYLPEPERESFSAWAKGFDDKMRSGHAHAKALGSRLYASVLKIAMLLQVATAQDWLLVPKVHAKEFDGSSSTAPQASAKYGSTTAPLRMEFISRASTIVDALAASTAEVLWKSSVNKDPFAAKREKVLEVIQSLTADGETCYYGRLSRMLAMSPRDLKESLLSLLDSGLVIEEMARLGSGKRTAVYTLAKKRGRPKTKVEVAPQETNGAVPHTDAAPDPAPLPTSGATQQQSLPLSQ